MELTDAAQVLDTATGTDDQQIVAVNNRGDVVIQVLRRISSTSAGTVKNVLWRTGRGTGTPLAIDIPTSAGASELVLNNDGDGIGVRG